MKVRATVSNHAHMGPITFLLAVNSGICPLHVGNMGESLENSVVSTLRNEDPDVRELSLEEYGGFTQSADHAYGRNNEDVMHTNSKARWTSTPDLRLMETCEEPEDNLQTLYGSLMQGLNEDDIELYEGKNKRKSHIHQNMKAKANAFNAKISQTVSKITGTPMSPGSKYATLPIVSEEGQRRDSQVRPDLASVDEEGSSGRSVSISDDVSSQTSQEIEIEKSQESNGPSNRNLLRKKPSIEPLSITQHSSVLSQQALGKLVTIVSGGAGHVNWNSSKADDLKYDDMCMLLWQCRV